MPFVSPIRHPYMFLAACSLLQLWPWFLFEMAGDSATYQFYMECFAQTLASGVLRPSWCAAADGGFGNTVFFFYFPLPYYLASIFYPLKMLGVSILQLFTLQLYLANALFAFTCFYWLATHTRKSYALLITFVLMLLPYRAELLFCRVAHAELFAVALLPLWLLAVERLLKQRSHWHPLALLAGITALTHLQMAFIFGIIISLYALFVTRQFRSLKPIIGAGIVGMLLAAFYIVPAAYYHPFIHGVDANTYYQLAFPNRYPMLEDFTNKRVRLLILSVLTLLAVIGLAWRCRHTIKSSRILSSWLLTFAICALLYSPLIAPLFDASDFIKNIFFPWRMQVVFIPVLAALLLTFLNSRSHEEGLGMAAETKKFKPLDLVIFFLFLVLLQSFALFTQAPNQEAKIARITESLVHPIPQYTTIWTPLDLPVENLTKPRNSEVVAGSAEIRADTKSGNRRDIHVRVNIETTMRIPQAYFPSWQARSAGRILRLYPDTASGDTLVDVPPGVEHITLENRPYANGNGVVRLSAWVSVITLVMLAWFWRQAGQGACNARRQQE